MKLFGKTPTGPKPEYIVIPREGGDIVFVANAVLNYDEFHVICPDPKPPVIMKPGGIIHSDINNPRYTEKLIRQSQLQTAWLIITSLKQTPGIEWETVDYNNPDTWSKYEDELERSNFTRSEINMIIEGVMTANSMDEKRMREARDHFLATKAEQPVS